MRGSIARVTVAVWGTFAYTLPLGAEQELRRISWSELARDQKLPAGEVVPSNDGEPWLKLANEEGQALTLTFLTIDAPGITGPRYAVRGEVRYQQVEGQGYFEMWSVFPDQSQYFTRTLAPSGPMQSIAGSSPARPLVLPFYIDGSDERPVKLVINLVLPGRGQVFVAPLQLVEYDANEDPLGVNATGVRWWWSDRESGLLGAIAGVLFGTWGALVGWLGGTGRSRGFVLGGMKVVMAMGALALVAGVAALARQQPYGVYYPLMLVGVLGIVIPAALLPALRKRYEQMEWRRMKARDAAL